jgi:hypothetical protein
LTIFKVLYQPNNGMEYLIWKIDLWKLVFDSSWKRLLHKWKKGQSHTTHHTNLRSVASWKLSTQALARHRNLNARFHKPCSHTHAHKTFFQLPCCYICGGKLNWPTDQSFQFPFIYQHDQLYSASSTGPFDRISYNAFDSNQDWPWVFLGLVQLGYKARAKWLDVRSWISSTWWKQRQWLKEETSRPETKEGHSW